MLTRNFAVRFTPKAGDGAKSVAAIFPFFLRGFLITFKRSVMGHLEMYEEISAVFVVSAMMLPITKVEN